MRLPGQLPLEQAQVPVAELVRLRVLVLGPVRELAQVLRLEQALVQLQELALGLQLERELPVVRVPELELVQAQELELARAAAPESRQARKLRVSRQQEQQQHRLLAAVQELLPYLPALLMKAPCWGAPAW